tara:strand:+ start:761 stop:1174 length:414 start_codon:yes stop_codon:yes gene_type:complete
VSYQNIYKLTIVNPNMRHPQEIEVWYIMPAIRKELCNILLDKYGFNQKEIANFLNITEAAVSQYKKEKRGQHVKLPESVLSEVNISAKKILNEESTVFRETQNILNHIRDTSTICDIHKMMDDSVESDCKECILHLK